jgi:hypothetical protein
MSHLISKTETRNLTLPRVTHYYVACGSYRNGLVPFHTASRRIALSIKSKKIGCCAPKI